MKLYLTLKSKPKSSDEVGGTVSAQVRNPCKNKINKKVGSVFIVQTPNPYAAGKLKDPSSLNKIKLDRAAKNTF